MIRAACTISLLVVALGCTPAAQHEEPVTPSPPAPELVEPAQPKHAKEPEPVEVDDAWVWVLPHDNGVRADKGGQGGFLAERYHGAHNGLDLLAAIGTPVLAPCAGKASAGKNASHGKWVRLICPLPARMTADAKHRATLFFAHLDTTVPAENGEAREIARGETVGTVGKTGNASGSDIAPHLHFEATIHDDEAKALAETHSGRDQSDTQAARAFERVLGERCLAATGLARSAGAIWRARRVDPFVLLTCTNRQKPAYQRPRGRLGESSQRWSEHYRATGIDVDTGQPKAMP